MNPVCGSRACVGSEPTPIFWGLLSHRYWSPENKTRATACFLRPPSWLSTHSYCTLSTWLLQSFSTPIFFLYKEKLKSQPASSSSALWVSPLSHVGPHYLQRCGLGRKIWQRAFFVFFGGQKPSDTKTLRTLPFIGLR